ncbi:MAG: hypothetical protein J5477_04725 [Schwartzia sp.]|nr:hypothetical protein [Schwartzia sp. (in: firmicutes)]
MTAKNHGSTPLPLSDASLIGRGLSKAVYAHPDDAALCVKIIENDNNDWRRELSYRKVRKRHGLTDGAIPVYYGPVETTLGEGFLFECIRDYDGAASATLADMLSGEDAERIAETALPKLRRLLMDERVILSDPNPDNFLVQKTAPDAFRLRVIDGLGTHATIPLMYWFDFMAKQYVRRFWNQRFRRKLSEKFPDALKYAGFL